MRLSWIIMIIYDNLMCRLSWNALEFTAIFLWGNRTIPFYSKQNTRMLGNMKLFLMLNRISHSFALLTRKISWSTLEINFIFVHIHVFSIYLPGRRFDKYGNLANWWINGSLARFQKRALCMVKQYGNFTVQGEKVNIHYNANQILQLVKVYGLDSFKVKQHLKYKIWREV